MTKTIRKGDSLSPDGACLLSHAAQPKNPATLEPTHYEVPRQVLIEMVCLFFKQE